MYYDYDALRKRAGIIDETTEADRKELEHQFWVKVDMASRATGNYSKAYAEAITELLKMVPSPLLQRYLAQDNQDTDEGY